jgi:hypothetical protein
MMIKTEHTTQSAKHKRSLNNHERLTRYRTGPNSWEASVLTVLPVVPGQVVCARAFTFLCVTIPCPPSLLFCLSLRQEPSAAALGKGRLKNTTELVNSKKNIKNAGVHPLCLSFRSARTNPPPPPSHHQVPLPSRLLHHKMKSYLFNYVIYIHEGKGERNATHLSPLCPKYCFGEKHSRICSKNAVGLADVFRKRRGGGSITDCRSTGRWRRDQNYAARRGR